jgi:hypothetical protein
VGTFTAGLNRTVGRPWRGIAGAAGQARGRHPVERHIDFDAGHVGEQRAGVQDVEGQRERTERGERSQTKLAKFGFCRSVVGISTTLRAIDSRCASTGESDSRVKEKKRSPMQ